MGPDFPRLQLCQCKCLHKTYGIWIMSWGYAALERKGMLRTLFFRSPLRLNHWTDFNVICTKSCNLMSCYASRSLVLKMAPYPKKVCCVNCFNLSRVRYWQMLYQKTHVRVCISFWYRPFVKHWRVKLHLSNKLFNIPISVFRYLEWTWGDVVLTDSVLEACYISK